MTTLTNSVAVRESDVPWVDIGVRPGYDQRYYGFFDKKQGIAIRVGSLYGQEYFHSPRHRHTFQQVRYVVSGKMRYGKSEIYGPGDCLYIPEGAYYGPIKPVEGSTEQLHYVDMQFEAQSGIPYPEPDEVVRARTELSEVGEFNEGIYKGPDGTTSDAYEAILEHMTGGKVDYPKPRINSYVAMHAQAYPWVSSPDDPEVLVRHLGSFFETGPNIKMYKVPSGHAWRSTKSTAHQVRLLVDGTFSMEGKDYESISYVMTPAGTECPEMNIQAEATLLVMQWNNGPDGELSFNHS